VSLDALAAALEAVRPGATSGDVHGAWHSAVVKGGYQINKRAGYSLGLAFAPDWGEGHLLDLKEGDATPLVPGMVFHIPSSIRVFGRQSVGVSETVLVTAQGHEVLTNVERRFFIR
jgi:Xaa-Pro dipeptidase